MTRLALTSHQPPLADVTVILRVPNMIFCCPYCRRGPQLGAKHWRVVSGEWVHDCPEKR